ncbi:SDR family oxidoreductase [Nocardia sp. NBC_01499]|uniref:SDR family oxidoreductase n=1 Tax=Nocardia sp. NBC_01499 TaxID=2903597 RepID=UPI0038654DC3
MKNVPIKDKGARGPKTRRLAVAVTGVSALMPGSSDVPGFWRDCLAGRDLMTEVPPSHWLLDDYYHPDPAAPDKTYARRGAFLSPTSYDPLAYGTPPTTLPATDVAQLLALPVAERALRDAAGGGELSAAVRERTGVIIGTGALELLLHMACRLQRPVWRKALRDSGVPDAEAEQICDRIADNYVPWQEATFPGLLSNVVAGRIANRLDLHGINCTTDAACASSLAALSAAVAELELGRTDLMLVGGVDTLNHITMYMCFSKTPALSPSGDCRPFSDKADGTMLGEGLAMFALKRLDDAERDGDRIYAVLRGVGSSSDGQGTAIYAPVPKGQARALLRTYDMAGYSPATVELVEAHGTGTKAGDLAEMTALSGVFAEAGPSGGRWCAVGSAKSQFGHTKSAAGAVSLMKAVLALQHRVLPPTIKVERPNPDLHLEDGPLYLNTEKRPWVRGPDHPRRASVSSFGFGGSNFHVTLEEYVPARGGRAAERMYPVSTELVMLSAGSGAELVDRLRSDSRTDFRASDPLRLSLVGAPDELDGLAEEAATRLTADAEEPFTRPGIQYRTGPAEPGKVAFLFSGQGAQYTGMGADLAMAFPEALAAWDETADLRFGDRSIHEIVFPRPVFDAADRQRLEDELRATEWAQPALAVQCAAQLRLAEQVGLRADLLGGHSFGELTALHAAGCFDLQALVRLARTRGELMRDAGGTLGGMVVIGGDAALAEALIGDHAALWVANLNSPDQTVVSGTHAALAALEQRAADRGVTAQRLNTSTGFHSPLVKPAGERLGAFLDALEIAAPGLPVYGNSDAARYPADRAEIRARLVRQLSSPVRFADQIEAMYDAGARTFVEFGAGTALTGLVHQILGPRAHVAVALDRKGHDGVTALQHAIGELAVHGVAIDAAPLRLSPQRAAPTGKNRMTVELLGTQYGKPYPPPEGVAPIEPIALDSTPIESRSTTDRKPHPPYEDEVEIPMPNDHDDSTRTTTGALVARADHGGAEIGPPRRAAEPTEWLGALQEIQRQTSEVHSSYQRALADGHVAYLRTSEATLNGMITALSGAPAADLASIPVRESPNMAVALPMPTTPATPERASGNGHAAVPRSPAESARSVTPALAQAAPATPDAPAVAVAVAPAPTPAAAAPTPTAAAPTPAVTAPTPAATPAAVEPTPEPAPAAEDAAVDIEDTLLTIMAELTGYPVDMLGTDMDLEHDLGVDSIKRVQILSTIRQRVPGLPKLDPAELARLRTMGEISGYLRRPEAAREQATPSRRKEESGGRDDEEGESRSGLTRLTPHLVPVAPPGLVLPGLLRGTVAVTDDGGGIAEALIAKLQDAGVTAVLYTDADADTVGLLDTVVFLGGLRRITNQEDGIQVERAAFRCARAVAARMTAKGGTFVTVQDTGGDFGISGTSARRAWVGGLAALARTCAREWPGATVKAIDCAGAGRNSTDVAAALAAELLGGGSAPEVALRADGTRSQLRLRPTPLVPGRTDETIDADSVIVVTGGARGVTAACTLALARARRPRLALIGRTALAVEPSDLRGAIGESGVRQALIARTRRSSRRPNPADVDKEVRRVLAVREVRKTLAELAATGSPTSYLAADITDPAAVRAALAEVRAKWGPITGLIHGAGVLADRLVADKTDRQFDRVVGIKAEGFGHLSEQLRADPVRLVCVFSSVVASYGNPGQCDYAMANRILEHLASGWQAKDPGIVVKSLAWGPWHGGMVGPELAEQFRRRDVDLIELAPGAAAFVEELTAGSPDVRVLIAAGAAAAMDPDPAEHTAEIMVSDSSHPQLRDHMIVGRRVVPLAMMLDWFLRAAVDADAGLSDRVLVAQDIQVLAKATVPDSGRANFVVHTRRTAGQTPQLELAGQYGEHHCRATVFPDGESMPHAPHLGGGHSGLAPVDPATAYAGPALFHGPRFQALTDIEGATAATAIGTVVGVRQLGWPNEPWRIDPAALDGAFQLAVLWAEQALGTATLPMSIRECRFHPGPPTDEPLRCVVRGGTVNDVDAVCDATLIRADGTTVAELSGLQLVARPR